MKPRKIYSNASFDTEDPDYIAREKKNRSIYSSSSLVNEFMRYHEDSDNYSRNSAGFDKMYDILNQYGNEDEDVDVVFKRAPLDVQRRMIDFIRPAVPYTTREGARQMYYDALDMNIENASRDYCEGVVDAIEALFASGWLDEYVFRTDL